MVTELFRTHNWFFNWANKQTVNGRQQNPETEDKMQRGENPAAGREQTRFTMREILEKNPKY